MNNFPTKKEEFKEFAGKFADNTPEAFKGIDAETIAVGGDPKDGYKTGSIECFCYICKALTLMHVKDIDILKNVNHVVVCSSCYLSGVECGGVE